MDQLIINDYRYIKKFRDFVDGYAKENGITPQEAIHHKKVREAWKRLTGF